MSNGTWMTYEALGSRLNIKSESARRKAFRANLQKRINNDGNTEVLVELDSPWYKGQPTPRHHKTSQTSSVTSHGKRQLKSEIDRISKELILAQSERDSALKKALEAESKANIAEAVASERAERISDLKDQIETLKNPPRRRWFWD